MFIPAVLFAFACIIHAEGGQPEDIIMKAPFYEKMVFVENDYCYYSDGMKEAYLVEKEGYTGNNYFHRIVSIPNKANPHHIKDNAIRIRDEYAIHLIDKICDRITSTVKMSYPPKSPDVLRHLEADKIPLVPSFDAYGSEDLKHLPDKYAKAIKEELEAIDIPATFNLELIHAKTVKNLSKTGKMSKTKLINLLRPAAADDLKMEVHYGDKGGILFKMLILYLYGSKFDVRGSESPIYIKPKGAKIYTYQVEVENYISAKEVLVELEKEPVMETFINKMQDMKNDLQKELDANKDKKYKLKVQLVCGVNKGEPKCIKFTCIQFTNESDETAKKDGAVKK